MKSLSTSTSSTPSSTSTSSSLWRLCLSNFMIFLCNFGQLIGIIFLIFLETFKIGLLHLLQLWIVTNIWCFFNLIFPSITIILIWLLKDDILVLILDKSAVFVHIIKNFELFQTWKYFCTILLNFCYWILV